MFKPPSIYKGYFLQVVGIGGFKSYGLSGEVSVCLYTVGDHNTGDLSAVVIDLYSYVRVSIDSRLTVGGGSEDSLDISLGNYEGKSVIELCFSVRDVLDLINGDIESDIAAACGSEVKAVGLVLTVGGKTLTLKELLVMSFNENGIEDILVRAVSNASELFLLGGINGCDLAANLTGYENVLTGKSVCIGTDDTGGVGNDLGGNAVGVASYGIADSLLELGLILSCTNVTSTVLVGINTGIAGSEVCTAGITDIVVIGIGVSYAGNDLTANITSCISIVILVSLARNVGITNVTSCILVCINVRYASNVYTTGIAPLICRSGIVVRRAGNVSAANVTLSITGRSIYTGSARNENAADITSCVAIVIGVSRTINSLTANVTSAVLGGDIDMGNASNALAANVTSGVIVGVNALSAGNIESADIAHSVLRTRVYVVSANVILLTYIALAVLVIVYALSAGNAVGANITNRILVSIGMYVTGNGLAADVTLCILICIGAYEARNCLTAVVALSILGVIVYAHRVGYCVTADVTEGIIVVINVSLTGIVTASYEGKDTSKS